MRYVLYPALVAVGALASLVPIAEAADGCAVYGDEKTDFTWRLCPSGKKYERRYLYFGVWNKFYRVNGDSGACSWLATKSSWV